MPTTGTLRLKYLRLWLMFLDESSLDFLVVVVFLTPLKDVFLFGGPSLLCRCFSAVQKFCARLCVTEILN